MNMIKAKQHTGKVILAGAGPGDPDLVTIKTVRWLEQADVVLVDRLVSKVILQRYVRPQTLIVPVGKQCRRGVSTPQQTINELLVQYAQQGKLVVRLKGGDVSFFSNVLDELETLVQHNIAYEIVPGVTAASGAAAYAGIPLTARDHATGVRFLTLYQSTVIAADQWKELAASNDTLVFYMSSETLLLLVNGLLDNGADTELPIAVVEQATTTYQQVFISTLANAANDFGDKDFLSPSLVIIGKVVNLHAKTAWFRSSDLRHHYFKPLTSTVKSIREDEHSQRQVDRA
jgi:uroporphyrin-III C-methyltransferase